MLKGRTFVVLTELECRYEDGLEECVDIIPGVGREHWKRPFA